MNKYGSSLFTTILSVGMLALSSLSVQAQEVTVKDEPKTLGKLVAVSDDEAIGVTPPGNAASNKGDIPLLETPQAISVVTAETIKQQNTVDLVDVLSNVAGVSRSSSYGFYDSYTIRGYDAAYSSLFLDGLQYNSLVGTNHETAGLEQVEVIKGSGSMLYGATPLGGIVNLISKRPLSASFVEWGLATGSYGLLEGSIDANAPLNGSGSLLGRVNLLYRDADGFVDYSHENRVYVAPAMTWLIADKTQFTLRGVYQRDHDNPWAPVIAYGTILPAAWGTLPVTFAVSRRGAYEPKANQDRKMIGYTFDHAFSDTIQFNQNLRYSRSKQFWDNWLFSDALLDSAFVNGVQTGHLWGLGVYGPYEEKANDFAVDNQLHATLVTGALRHKLTTGVDFKRNAFDYHDDGSNFDYSANVLDVLAPDYDAPLIHDPAAARSGMGKSRQIGYYLREQLNWHDQFYVTLGGRWDQTKRDDIKEHAFSPNAGVNYLVTPGIAMYANWARSFTLQGAWMLDINGNTLKPEYGRNVEVGLKVGDASEPFNALVAVFELTRQNVPNADPVNPFVYVTTGEQRSRGVEVEGAWKPTAAFKLSLAYSFIDAVITRDDVYPTGVQLANVPKHNLYMRGDYEIQNGGFRNLGLNLSVLHNSSKNGALGMFDYDGDGDDDPALQLPGYTLVDAGLSYPVAGWQTRLSVNNLFDNRHYPEAGWVTRVTPGEPRNWRLSIAKRFGYE